MKKFYTALVALLLTTTAIHADELSDAYNKEYTFLKAQKAELQSRMAKEKAQQQADLAKAKAKAKVLQDKYLKLTEEVKTNQKQLDKIKEQIGEKEGNSEITGSVVLQAQMTMEEYGLKLPEGNQTTNSQKMEFAFTEAAKLYDKLSATQVEKGDFFLPDGSIAQGEIVKLGNIAAYGISDKAAGALAPAGNGEYKLWNAVGSSDDAKALYGGKPLDSIDVFVYENIDKEIEYTKEKTLDDILEGGGVIGYVILALGALGLVLLVIRVFILMATGSNVNKITNTVENSLKNGKSSDEALQDINSFGGAPARVAKATLRNVGKDREHIEDIVAENILNESNKIDKFGSFVMVIAAVAPLLGLLGTVSGMIATFDMITEHGTGDPKMLSVGISEALVTTMFGLIVAIPLLLLGNLIAGWAQRIKDAMEQSALHIVNIYSKYNA
ncbi:MAG TPA: flagellar motor protein MotA [Campylobacterales bacterium]|nr:flagellar motor protein MotA [Campylobacterales bacterium]